VAVSGEFRVDVRPYSAYEDPGLPVAAYIAQAGLAGDASGGDLFIDFLFKRSDDEFVSELFNLELVSIDTTVETARNFMISTLNMDSLAPNRPASPQKWRVRTQAAPGGTAMDAAAPMNNQLPFWLGSPNRSEGNGGLRFQTPNVDTILYAVTIQGYVWGPRSVLAPGGPRRPGTGLF